MMFNKATGNFHQRRLSLSLLHLASLLVGYSQFFCFTAIASDPVYAHNLGRETPEPLDACMKPKYLVALEVYMLTFTMISP